MCLLGFVLIFTVRQFVFLNLGGVCHEELISTSFFFFFSDITFSYCIAGELECGSGESLLFALIKLGKVR